MLSLPLLLLYACIGCVEWALALTRTIFTIRHNMMVVPLTVFCETLVAMLVFKNFIQTGDWLIACAYSLGSAAGSLIPMLCTKRRKEDSNGTD
jgi:hypothetical protein